MHFSRRVPLHSSRQSVGRSVRACACVRHSAAYYAWDEQKEERRKGRASGNRRGGAGRQRGKGRELERQTGVREERRGQRAPHSILGQRGRSRRARRTMLAAHAMPVPLGQKKDCRDIKRAWPQSPSLDLVQFFLFPSTVHCTIESQSDLACPIGRKKDGVGGWVDHRGAVSSAGRER